MKRILIAVALIFFAIDSAIGEYCGGQYYDEATHFCCDVGRGTSICDRTVFNNCEVDGGGGTWCIWYEPPAPLVCPVGTYKANYNTCTPCAVGHTTAGQTSTQGGSPTTAPCNVCVSGYTMVNGNCMKSSGITVGVCEMESCVSGYYANSTSCAECPGKSNGATSTDRTAGDATNCYIPSNVQKTDTGGTWEFIQNCYYKI